jgi:two-component system cell cycle response regulator
MLPLILLIDDEEEILNFLQRTLSSKYSILKAESAAAGLEILQNEAVQLIICDVMMPEMDGFEFCKIVKSDFEHSHIPVILLTAKNTIQAKVQGLETGAEAYIEKPFSKEYLLAQIASLLANRNKLREYFAGSPLVHLKSIAHSRSDERFLENLNEMISEKIEDTELDVEKLAGLMNMSRVTLYRKIKAISNLSPLELINIIRLKKAAELLATGDHKMYEISAFVGYSSQSNFARNFQKQFNMTPTKYMHSMYKKRKNVDY